MSIAIKIILNPELYLRDPQETSLGRKIIQQSILLIDELGFEKFTFKKLATRIESTEASVYRYFENKHLLLLYMVSWYWQWVNFQIDFGTININDNEERLRQAIKALVASSSESPAIEYVNEQILHRIIVAEGAKAYHTKEVDKENEKGLFSSYNNLVSKIAGFILDVNPKFQYPEALASNLVEMANNHIYFAEHLPELTNINVDGGDWSELESMLEYFAFKLIEPR